MSPEVENIAKSFVDSAFRVHKTLGPGLLESVYETCLEHELNSRKIPVERQKPIPIIYNEIKLETDLRVDLIVNSLVLVELKAVEKMN
ncbi:GxxExxY protein, partial [candidate division TA06 bacterium]|nr:GxxExxY protein [candidate division TA06 bacterium]